MDIGSGMAILAFYLREKDWSNPVTAIDYDERKIEAGNLLIQKGGYQGITLERGDARESLPTHQGDVTILDILQFFQKTDQIKLLELAAENVAPGAKLLIRSGIKERNFRFFITWVVDVFAKCSFWMKAAPTYYPTKETFEGVFGKEGFDLEIRPFWGNTPFNNYLVVIKKLK